MKFQSFGTPRLRTPDGRDITPKSAKAVALIALLLDSEGQTRSRRWIESMLWPEKAPKQASGSLRQVLHQIRQAIGEDHVETDRHAVSLHGVTKDTEADADANALGQDYLEGLDIDSPAFNDWLVTRRNAPSTASPRPTSAHQTSSHQTQQTLPAGPPVSSAFVIRPHAPGDDAEAGFLCRALADSVSDLLQDFGSRDIYQSGSPQFGAEQLDVALPENGLDLNIETISNGRTQFVRFALRAPMSGRVYWTHRTRAEQSASIDDTWFQETVFRCVEAAYRALTSLPRDQATAEGLAAQGLRNLFRFDADGHAEAEAFFEQALLLDDQPVYHAWKAMLHQMQAVERTRSNWADEVARAQYHMRRAEETEMPSSMTCALLAQCHVMLNHDAELGALYAEKAKELNPNNAFAYSAIACAELRRGDLPKAFEAANIGATLAAFTAYAPWWHLLAGLSAMAMDRFDDAIYHYRKASMHAPNFRAPLRNLFVLYHATGQEQEAQRYKQRLLVQEPDFSLHRLKTDMDYPASTIRASSIMALI